MNGLKLFFQRFSKPKVVTGALTGQTSPLNVENENLRSQLLTSSALAKLAAETAGDQLLMKEISDLLQQRCLLHFVGVFLLDTSRDYAVLQYGTGDQGRQMLSASYRLAASGYSLVGKCIQTREPVSSIADESNPSRFENPFLPHSRFELALPLTRNDQLFGVLNVHSAAPRNLDENALLLLDQAANLLALSLQQPSYSTQGKKSNGFLNLDEIQKIDQYEPNEVSVNFENPAYLKPRTNLLKHSIPLVMLHETVGSLDLEIDEQEWSAEKSEFVQAVAAQALSALGNLKRLNQTILQAERESKILEITSKIRSTNDSQKMLQITLEEISKHLGVSQAQIVLNVPEIPKSLSSIETNTKSLQKKMTTGQLPEL